MINTLTKVLDGSIKFPTSKRTTYGLDHVVAILAEMCRSGTTSTDAVSALENDDKDIPTERWFLNVMHSIKPHMVKKICENMVSQTVNMAIKEGLSKDMRGVQIGIDKHLICRYDKNNMRHLIYSENKNGTKRFEAYATMQVVGSDINPTLKCMRVTRSVDNVDFVREFVQTIHNYKIRTHQLLLDREFFAVNIMQTIEDGHLKFLMPGKKDAKAKKSIKEYHNGTGDAVTERTIRNSKGEEFTFRQVIVRRSEEYIKKMEEKKKNKKSKTKDDDSDDDDITNQYIVFATNLTALQALRAINELTEYYRKRWGIETGYRQIESIRPWTTSRNDAYRRILFAMALFLYNMWAIEQARARTHHVTITLMMLARIALAIARKRLSNVPDDPGGGCPDTEQAARHDWAGVEEAAVA